MKSLYLILLVSTISLAQLGEDEKNFLKGNFENAENVYELNLENQNLTELPDAFDHYPELLILNLGKNKLKNLPPSLFHAKNLALLYIFENELIEIPEDISQLINLETLDVSQNKIKKISSAIGKLNLLNRLYIDQNQIENLPESVCKLTSLNTLDFSKNQLKSIPTCMNQLDSLQTLYLSENKFEHFPKSVFGLKNLTILGYNQDQNPEISQDINQLKSLEYLFINENYYHKNKSQINKWIPKGCKVNEFMIPPPMIDVPEIEPIDTESSENLPSSLEESLVFDNCFVSDEEMEEDGKFVLRHFIIELNNSNGFYVIETKIFDTKEKREEVKKGTSFALKVYMTYVNGTLEMDEKKVKFIPTDEKDKEFQKEFNINYNADKSKIESLTDRKNGKNWKKGTCHEVAVSAG